MFKSFSYYNDGEVIPLKQDAKYTTTKLEPNIYELHSRFAQNQGVVHNLTMRDDLICHTPFRSKSIDIVLAFVEKFYKRKTKTLFKKLDYVYKAGLLFYGKQGAGKTNLMLHIAKHLVETKKALVFIMPDADSFFHGWEVLEEIRENHTNPIVILYDECEKFFGEWEEIGKVRLDGFESIDNLLCLFSTNYIEKIPDSIKDRASRIKYAVEINGIEDVTEVEEVLKRNYAKIDVNRDFKDESESLKGATVDDIKNHILDDILSIDKIKKGKKLGFGS